MTRLLVIGAGWPNRSTFIERKLQALASAGIQVIILTRSKSTNLLPSLTQNIQIARLPSVYSIRSWMVTCKTLASLLFHKSSDLRNVLKIIRQQSLSLKTRLYVARDAILLANLQPDIVHFEWNSAAINYEWMFDWCATVISCRGRQVNIWPYMPNKSEFTKALKRTLGKASAVHCVSQALKNNVIELGVKPEKAHVIYTAIDPNFYMPLDKRGDQKNSTHLITVGALIWRKGFEYALLALNILLEEGFDVNLEIIGDGVERDRIEYTAHDLGIADQVQLTGQLSPIEVRNHLQNSDIFILSSLSEGLANVVVEAMACGLPIVTTDCGGMREAVENGVEGFVVPTRNAPALAEAVIQMIKNPTLMIDMGNASRLRALRQFDLNNQAKQFITLYQDLMSSTLK